MNFSLSIQLSKGFVSKVSVDDKVLKGQVIAHRHVREDSVINISKVLGVPVNKISKYLLYHPGDRILENETIAIKKGALGGIKKVVSPVSGTLLKFEEATGSLYIRRQAKEVVDTIFSPVDGIVTLCDNEKIVIDTLKDAVLGKNSLGEEVRGEIIVEHQKEVEYTKLSAKVSGKILLGRFFGKDALFKALGLGVLGIIGTYIRDQDLEDLRKKEMKTSILVINEEDFEKIGKHQGTVLLYPKERLIILG